MTPAPRAALTPPAPAGGDLRVLQCGYSKSGNYLLHRLLSGILEAHGRFRSFVAASGVGAAIDALCGATRRMPDARRVDNWKLVDGAWHVQFPNMRCRFLPLDVDLALRHSTLVWSHDTPTALAPWQGAFSHRFYLLRDGRDVVNSMLHYLVTPAMLRLYPDHRYATLAEIYADLDFFAGKVIAWRDHVRAFVRDGAGFEVVRYEELVADRIGTVERLARHLGLPVDAAAIAAPTALAAMRRAAPRHVRAGRHGDWRRHFGPEHRRLFAELAGAELAALGYAADEAA